MYIYCLCNILQFTFYVYLGCCGVIPYVDLSGSETYFRASIHITVLSLLHLSILPGNDTRLLIVQRSSLGLLNVKTQEFEAINTPVTDPVALTFDGARGWYFWADHHGSIYKCDRERSWTIYTG